MDAEKPPDWTELPFLLLVSIFQNLNFRDRLYAGQVCSSWRKACAYPGLWRDLRFSIKRDIFLCSQPTRIFLVKYGHYVRTLSVVDDHENKAKGFRNSYSNRPDSAFWLYLCDSRLQVTSINLQNWKYDSGSLSFANRWHLEFFAFIRLQRQLKSLKLNNVQLNALEWTTLFEAMRGSRGFDNQIKVLTLLGRLPNHSLVTNYPAYLISLSKLGRLRHLSLDYGFCSDGVLYTLAEGAPDTFRTFSITYSKPIETGISGKAWSTLLMACPLLQVTYNFKCTCVDMNIFHTLHEGLPLRKLKFTYRAQDSKWFPIKRFLRKCIQLYSYKLRKFEILVKDNTDNLDKILLLALEQCKSLESLQFSGVIREILTVWKICEFLHRHPEKFQTFYGRAKFLNTFNRMNIQTEYEAYMKMLKEKDIRLLLEIPEASFH